tara:strand:+ start:214 stop:705 length:492 start_codon:yes stop_codon:yes gene_type:complete
MKDGINIDLNAAEEQLVPEDLNSLAVGSYKIPKTSIRNRYKYIFLLLSIISLLLNLSITWINFIPASIILFIVSLFMFLLDNRINIKQNEVIAHVSQKIPHSIGYYSIALTFNFSFTLKLLNPVWTVIIYDHNNPPKKRSIIEFNSFTKKFISDVYTENLINA